MENNAYKKLAAMLGASFITMYSVMFLNVDEPDHIYLSVTRTYMTLLMVSPMAVMMLLMIGKMYMNKKANAVIICSGLAVFCIALVGLRTQAGVSDVQYMKAMIPHHSSAILTSSNANLKDPEVKKLADGIIEAQKKEIAEMKTILQRMEK